MTTSILSKVLGNNAFYTDTYIKDTITFVKSFLIKNHEEAKLYNSYLKLTHPTHVPDQDPSTWRYYHHLQGLSHPLDTPITLTSVDNGALITLNRTSLQIHKKTRNELLKFGLLFDTLVKQHPQQQLYVKAVVLNPIYTDIQSILSLADFTIVACDSSFIEDNEHDVVPKLQQRINNYKSIWLIPYYQNLDNLFLASQYTILYQFLFTSLLAIRLEHAKTIQAHSFHIRLYLASHYRLDEQMLFLSKRQQLYLYRNLRYLNNHAGKNHVFRSLINELFNEHNVSVISYVHNQQNTLTPTHHVNYVYNQQLLNSKRLVSSTIDYPLSHLQAKEEPLAPGNPDMYRFKRDEIDSKNRRSLFSTLLTKDLETILIDETDSVKYKLTETITDYWAYLMKLGLMNFVTEVTDPLTNLSTRLSTQDTFKLYVITLFASQGVSIDVFPTYRIKRVFTPTVPTPEQLQGLFYKKRLRDKGYLKTLCEAIPNYNTLMTSFEFGVFVTQVYRLNIGVWHMLTNYSDIDTEGQMTMAVDALTIEDTYTYDDESVATFLERVGVKDPREYDRPTLTGYAFAILDEVFDKKLTYIKRLRKLQEALAQVFFNFNSYTVQLINNYYNDSPVLAGMKDRRYGDMYRTVSNIGGGGSGSEDGFTKGSHHSLLPSHLLCAKPLSTLKDRHQVGMHVTAFHTHTLRSCIDLDALVGIDIRPYHTFNVYVNLVKNVLLESTHSLKSIDNTDVFFPMEITHLQNRHFTEIDVAFHSTVNSKTRYRSYMHQTSELNVHAVDDPVQAPADKSSDPTLMFLALNS